MLWMLPWQTYLFGVSFSCLRAGEQGLHLETINKLFLHYHNAQRAAIPPTMSSPHSSAQRRPPESIRNPRRRRRNDSETLRQQPRKRSKISDDTFKSRSEGQSNGDSGTNGHIIGDEHGSHLHPQLPVREKRQASSSHRSTKGDGSTTLVIYLERD